MPALSDQYAGYSAPCNLDFTNSPVRAYAAWTENGNVHLQQLTIVPANTGILVRADSTGIYDVQVAATAEAPQRNELVATSEKTVVPWTSGDGYYNYILNENAFRKATGAKLAARRAYLHTPYDVMATGSDRLAILLEQERDSFRLETTTLLSRLAPYLWFLLGVGIWFGGLWLYRWTRRRRY